MLDASANDTLLDKPPRESLEILEKLAQNDYQHPTTQRGNTRRGTAQLDSSYTILAQISALTNMVKNMQRQSNTQEVKALDAFCELCGNNHDASECGQAPESSCYVGNFNKNADSSAILKSLRVPLEQCKAISTRSGKVREPTNKERGTAVAHTKTSTVTNTPAMTDIPAKADEDLIDPTETKEVGSTAEASQTEQTRSDKLEEIRPPLPFPQRLKKQKQDYQFKKFFDILIQDMVSRKRRIGEFETAATTETCLALMHNKPEGKIEDILVRIDKFIFPTDFLILDCEADKHAPIILGRPFLTTSRAIIGFDKDEIAFSSGSRPSEDESFHNPWAVRM
ncbi:hypothetical protein V6N13_006208 [Hibiscus sabdariffa]